VDATESVALLGPTNTGKTHQAVERMLEHASGMIGLPLRLLAREIYDRVSARLGEERVALVTGEEKRIPRRADYWICTTEAMPLTHEVDFLAVDEVQLAAHDERGHVFTDRLLHARGRKESWFLGAGTMRSALERLVPAARHKEMPRLSRLSFAGSTKLQRLPPRSAVVGFSVPELYALAERLRVLRGGAAVVLGALSPRARNAQVALFQSGEVDYLVATDAIGMGLNLDVAHVAFASLRKFDGRTARSLADTELAQIAGRAGRYLRDGSFGTLSPLTLPTESALRIEQHRFDAVRRVRYRNSALDFSSPAALLGALEVPPPFAFMASVPDAVDLLSLRTLLRDEEIARAARGPEALELLWLVCQIPDFRHILFEVHLALMREIFVALTRGPLSSDFLATHTKEFERVDGDVETIVARIARLRTWAFVVNRAGWAASPALWCERLAALEDRLSDALHEGLMARYVERRARTGRTQQRSERKPKLAPAEAEIDRAHPFAALEKLRARVRETAPEPELVSDLSALCDAPHEAFTLGPNGEISGQGQVLARLVRGATLTQPDVRLAPLEELGAGAERRLQRRLLAYARDTVTRLLEGFRALHRAERAPLRAIAYQLDSGLGSALAIELRSALAELEAEDHALLAQAGVRVGRVAVFAPNLLHRAALELRALLLRVFLPSLKFPELGRPTHEARLLSESAWLSVGYIVLGPRACRVDLVERAAQALAAGAPENEAFRSLSIARREVSRVSRALREASHLREREGVGIEL